MLHSKFSPMPDVSSIAAAVNRFNLSWLPSISTGVCKAGPLVTDPAHTTPVVACGNNIAKFHSSISILSLEHEISKWRTCDAGRGAMFSVIVIHHICSD